MPRGCGHQDVHITLRVQCISQDGARRVPSMGVVIVVWAGIPSPRFLELLGLGFVPPLGSPFSTVP